MGRSLEQFILQARRASLSCFRGLPPRDRQFIEIRGACHEYILEAIPPRNQTWFARKSCISR